MKLRWILGILMCGAFAPVLTAEEVSLVSGFYRSSEVDGGIGQSEISLGGRYGLDPEDKGFWFFQGSITQTSYSGDNAPDSGSGFRIGGGKRYLQPKLSKRLTPYLAWVVEIASDKQGDQNQQTESTGVFYSGQVGLRLLLSGDFFVDLEAILFQSALTATTKVTDNNGNEVETSRTELYVDSFSSFNDVVVSLGMKL